MISRKERMQLPRVDMPAQDPLARISNFGEVNLGLNEAAAVLEASRCLLCPVAKCEDGCPVSIRIKDFLAEMAEGHFSEAIRLIKEDNSLPAICGRVCPQEIQCEGACVLIRKGRPIAIGALERFLADYEREHAPPKKQRTFSPSGKRVAIVGSGPAGLACAADLIQAGHQVTVFEALHELGGVLVYGIPEYRLPKEIVRVEIQQLEDMGVEFRTDEVIGMIDTLDDLLDEEGYDAVFLGVGAGLPRFMGIPGENLVGVYSANEYLTRVNLMKAYLPESDTPVLDVRGKPVAVVGGGNTAMDAVRTPLRLGAAKASIVYRRSEEEMPARQEEVEHAKEEGVDFVLLSAPVEIFGDESARVTGMRIQKMELGEPDESGRRRPVPIEGSEYDMPVEIVIMAIGNAPNPLLLKTAPDLEQTRRGTIVVDESTGRTTKRGVFAGGDIVTGGATVILAMGAGRKAAQSISEYLETGVWEIEEAEPEPSPAT